MTDAAADLRPKGADQAALRSELYDLIKTRSFKRGRFTLSSGRESELYFNLKPTMMNPRGAYLSALSFLDVLEAEGAAWVGGLEMGAVPIIGAVAALGEADGRAVKTFFVRKRPKEHGTQDLVEGLGPSESLDGQPTVVADDVATSGASILRAVEAARAGGANVRSALVLIDREEGAAAFLEKHEVRLNAIFKGREFLD